MKKACVLTGVLGVALLAGALDCRAENWVKKEFASKAVQANYEDADSVKSKDGLISWTEKFVLTDAGRNEYNKLLTKYKGCKDAMAKKGPVTYHQVDFEIKDGKFRRVAKRNYNKKDEVVCTDKDTEGAVDLTWHRIGRKSPMEDTYYHLVTKYKVGG